MQYPFGPYEFSMSVLAISIMLSISGIALGLGYAINDKRMKEFGKSEITQSVINGALVGSLMLLFSENGLVQKLINSLVMQNGTSMSCNPLLASNAAICFSYNYLVGPSSYTFMGLTNQSILTASTTLLAALYGLYAILGAFSTFISPILGQIRSAAQMLGAVAVGATVQASILIFVAASAITILLPLGLVLRSFRPTRKLGGFLMALTIGLYVVLPLSYVLDATIANSYVTASNSNALSNFSAIGSSFLSKFSNATNTASVGFAVAFSSLWNEISSALVGVVNFIIERVSYLIVYVFVLPAFSLMITTVAVKELAELLGSEVPFFKLSLS